MHRVYPPLLGDRLVTARKSNDRRCSQLDLYPLDQSQALQPNSDDLRTEAHNDEQIPAAWSYPGICAEEVRHDPSTRSVERLISVGGWSEVDDDGDRGNGQGSQHLLHASKRGTQTTPNDDTKIRKPQTLRHRKRCTSLRLAISPWSSPSSISGSSPNDTNSSPLLFQEKTTSSRNRNHFNSGACALSPSSITSPVDTYPRQTGKSKGESVGVRSVKADAHILTERRQWQVPKSLLGGSDGYTRFPSLNNLQHRYQARYNPSSVRVCKTCGKPKRCSTDPARDYLFPFPTSATYSAMDAAGMPCSSGHHPDTWPLIDSVILSPRLPVRSQLRDPGKVKGPDEGRVQSVLQYDKVTLVRPYLEAERPPGPPKTGTKDRSSSPNEMIREGRRCHQREMKEKLHHLQLPCRFV